MTKYRLGAWLSWVFLLTFMTQGISAEQKVVFDDWEVHYSLFNSTFLTASIAEHYGITRAKDRAVLTVSVLNPEAESVDVKLSGSYQNQLSQKHNLSFKKIEEDAIYYIAIVRFTDREILRFNVVAELPQGNRELSFQQKLYVDR